MREWHETTLGKVLTLQRGFDLPATDRKPGQYPVIASTGPVGTHIQPMVKGPGVVIGRSGSLGGGQYIRGEFWPLNTTLWVKDFQGNDPRFCYYLLKSLDLAQFNAGSGVPTLNRNHIHPLPVRLPSDLTEQEAIADILGSLDDKIELNRRMNETLEAMARAVFKSWFVDFDPVHAKSKGRQPEGMDAETAKLFPSSFEDSEIGRIPKGWKTGAIGDCVTVVGGSTPSTTNPSFWDGTHCFCTPKDLSALSSPVLLDTERKITDEGVEQISSGLLSPGTVLLSSRAPIGYLVITEVPTTVNQGFIAMICDKCLPNFFVLRWAEANMDLIEGNANGTTFMEISKTAFRPIRVIIPPTAILTEFVKVSAILHARVVNNLKEIASLAKARDALLPRLLSGELTVPASRLGYPTSGDLRE